MKDIVTKLWGGDEYIIKANAIYSSPPQSLVTISFIFGDIFNFKRPS